MKTRTMRYKGMTKTGFTLVEVVCVIVIIMLLSAISAPVYKNYRDKVVLAEGYALLGTIRSAQERYYAEYGNFLYPDKTAGGDLLTCYVPALEIDARTNKYFKKFRVNMRGGTDMNTGENFIGNYSKFLFLADVQSQSPYYMFQLSYNLTAGAVIKQK